MERVKLSAAMAYCIFCDENGLRRVDASDRDHLENWAKLCGAASEMATNYMSRANAARRIEDCLSGL